MNVKFFSSNTEFITCRHEIRLLFTFRKNTIQYETMNLFHLIYENVYFRTLWTEKQITTPGEFSTKKKRKEKKNWHKEEEENC